MENNNTPRLIEQLLEKLKSLSNSTVDLISRLIARCHSSKIVQKIEALGLATVLAFTLASCQPGTTDPNDDYSDVGGSGENKNDYSEYSKLLQNIMSSKQYNDLIAQAQKDNKFYNSAEFDAHPYAFLEKEGYDIAAIKNGQIACHTMTYTLDEEPEYLYMYTRVEEGNACSNYLLRYKLTEQEMDDYIMLNYTGRTKVFVQAFFLNNEISRTRNPEIIGTSKMTMEAYEGLLKTYSDLNLLKTNFYEVALINPDKNTGTFTVVVFPSFRTSDTTSIENKIIYFNCQGVVRFKDGVYIAPYASKEVSAISRTDKPGICFYTGNIVLVDAYYTTFENNK